MPIVNTGKLRLQDYQGPSLEACEWGLFENDETIDDDTVTADLTEPSWSDYGRRTVGPMGASSLVGDRAQAVPDSMPSWHNTSGGDVEIFGWFLVDPADETLIAAVNIGSVTIPDGATYVLSPAITDTQE
jgi:hypothetical protein